MADLKYRLVVQNGKIVEENGHFFVAGPFKIVAGDQTVQVEFKKGSQKKVVYAVNGGNVSSLELTHPDYAPDCEPGQLEATFGAMGEVLFAALVQCGITINKAYRTHFLAEDIRQKQSFEILQETFI